MTTTETHRAALHDLIDGICTGRLLEVFDKCYADDVVMSENNDPEQTRTGKPTCRAYEEVFVQNATFHGVEVGPVIADGDTTTYRMWMDMSFGEHRVQRDQFAMQTWKDGRIVKEVFYYKG